MTDVQITYGALDSSDLRGATQTDYLVSLEAELRVLVGGATIYTETAFPVVELARALRHWLAEPDRGDFEFDSMSFEEVGSVTIRRSPHGWVISSVFASSSPSSPLAWADVRHAVELLIRSVERDLLDLGADPGMVLGS